MDVKEKRRILIALWLASILIASSVSFHIGSQTGNNRIVVAIEPTAEENIEISTRVLVSARGKKYYPWWCSAGDSISEKNKRWFSSPENAMKAGYTIATSCE